MPFDPLNPGDMENSRRPVRRDGAPRRPGNPSGGNSRSAAGNSAGPRKGAGSAPRSRSTENLPARRTPARVPGRANPGNRRRPSGKGGYQPKYAAPKGHSRNKKSNLPLILLILVLAIASAGLIAACIHMAGGGEKTNEIPQADITVTPEQQPSQQEEKSPETTSEPLPELVSTAKITVTGDLLPHKTVYGTGSIIYRDAQDYNFDPLFKFLGGYADGADYSIANLETTLRGPDLPYSGNPKFNTPDQLVDSVKKSGFDMLLTANNHCNDTDIAGVLRTVQVIRDKGLTALGTNLTHEEPKYHIEDLNGIKVGMLCYTYEDSQNPNMVTLNYNPLPAKDQDLVCTFPKFTNAKSRDPFYEGLADQISQMRSQGAEAIVLFVHWGEEYHLEASQDQRDMAQKFCDMGIDLVVGGHPHVVEPVELLTSTQDPSHKMVCLYSLGNAFSNQRREEMQSQPSGHTEDGMLFNFTFKKYSDQSVYLSHVEVIPTWVDKHSRNQEQKREYNILPLDNEKRGEWQSLYALDDAAYQNAIASYDRTMAIVGEGLKASNEWLSQRLPETAGTGETGSTAEIAR